MKIPNDSLEEFFQNSLKGFEAEPPADTWQRMEPLIPPKPKRNLFGRYFNGLFVLSLLGIFTSAIIIYRYQLKLSNLEHRIVQHEQDLNSIQSNTVATSAFVQQAIVGDDLVNLNNQSPLSNNHSIVNAPKGKQTKNSNALLSFNNNNTTTTNLAATEKTNFNINQQLPLTTFDNNKSTPAFTQKTKHLLFDNNKNTNTENNAFTALDLLTDKLSSPNTPTDLPPKLTAIGLSDFSLTKKTVIPLSPVPEMAANVKSFEKTKNLQKIPLVILRDLQKEEQAFEMPIKPIAPRPRTFLELSFTPLYNTSDYDNEFSDLIDQRNSQMSVNTSLLLGIQLIPKVDLNLEIGLGWRKAEQFSQFSKDFYYLKNQATNNQNRNAAVEYTFEFQSTFGNIPYNTKIRSQIIDSSTDFIEGHILTIDYSTNHRLSILQIPLFLQYRMGHRRLKYTLKGGVIMNRLIKDDFSIQKAEVANESNQIRIAALGSSTYLAGSKWANMNLLFSAGLEYQMRSNLYFIVEPSLIRGQKAFYRKRYPWATALNLGLRVQL